MKNQKRHTVFMAYGVRDRPKMTEKKAHRAFHFVVLVLVLRGHTKIWQQSPKYASEYYYEKRKNCCFHGFFYEILRHVKYIIALILI